jgi:NAD dependent epimerase/dehydratase
MNLDNKSVLVTGADGFIGSHLAEMLVGRARQVRALAVYNSLNSYGWLDGSPRLGDIEVVTGDVRDPLLCRQITKGVDVVFHLAALIAIPYSYSAPSSYVDTNVHGTLNMCLAARDNGCERIVATSTSEVYGTARYVPIDEGHPLQPQSPYSASKIAADAIALSCHNAYKLPVIVARPFNTYGPRQSARAVIPTVITQLASGATTLRIGDLRPTRDFNYVEDTCRGMIALAGCDAAVGDTVNIGSGFEITIGETIALIQSIMGTSATLETDEVRLRPENSEVFRLFCGTGKLTKLTGHQHQVGLRTGLERTVAWFTQKHNLARYKPGTYNV